MKREKEAQWLVGNNLPLSLVSMFPLTGKKPKKKSFIDEMTLQERLAHNKAVRLTVTTQQLAEERRKVLEPTNKQNKQRRREIWSNTTKPQLFEALAPHGGTCAQPCSLPALFC
jgi:hypothetical protein